MTQQPLQKPRVSVVIDGYNESRQLGTVADTLDALRRQDFPLDRVEIILIGSTAQIEGWRDLYARAEPFGAIRTVAADDAHYLELKNTGAQHATAPIIAFTDSDVYPKPTWLTAIVEGIDSGADVVTGISLFKGRNDWRGDAPTRQAAASITWGWVVGKGGDPNHPPSAGFMDHNFAVRAEVARDHQYRTDLGRLCGAPLLFRKFQDSGLKIKLQPKQQVVHFFSWPFWLIKLHFRYGYEVHLLRRTDASYPNRWIARTFILEPIITMIWHVLLDQPRWVRVSRHLDMPMWRRLAQWPLLTVMSAAARSFELAGMVCMKINPKAMKQWAESV